MNPKEKDCDCTPRLRFPEFAGEKWEIYLISNFLSESQIEGSRGNTAKKLTVKLWGKGVCEKKENYTGSVATRYFKRKAGQFIYSKLDFLNQSFGIIPQYLDGFESTIDLPCFDFKNGINPVFFLNYVMRPDFYKKNGEIADGGRKAKRIQQESFLKFSIAVPSLPEQQKIADCLSSLDDLITAHEQKCDALKQHKKGLMQRLFPAEGETTPRWRFPEFREAGEWERHSLGTMTTKIGSGVTPTGGDKNYLKEGIPFVRSQNIGWGNLLLTDLAFISNEIHKKLLSTELSYNDVLLNITGASIGRCATVEKSIVGGNVNQHVCIIRTKANKLNSIFLMQYIISAQGQKQVDSFQAGGNRQGLNFAQVSSFIIPVPTLPEQQKIADCLSSLDERIAAQEAKIAALREHKKGLMQRLFPKI